MILRYLFAVIIAYLLGSISFGIIISRLEHKDDIRKHGSGNAGMTNALRVYGKRTAAFVFVGDFLKGTLCVYLCSIITGSIIGAYLAGLFVILGHLFPVYFGFKGGKGVATAAGAILALDPIVLLMLAVPFVLILFTTYYMSLASITVAVLFPIFTAIRQFFWLKNPPEVCWITTIFAVVIGGLVIYMHRANIKRLCNGTENRLKAKK